MDPMLTALSVIFDQDLVKGIEERLGDVDSAYSTVVTSSERVVQDEITKDYKVLHTFCRSLAGVLRYGSPLGPSMLDNTGATKIISAHDTYPGISDMPLPGVAQRYITLGKLRGNIPMNTAIARGNKLNTVGDYPALILQQSAKMVAHSVAVNWYLNDSAQAAQLDVTGSGANVTVSGHVVTCTSPTAVGNIIAAGRARRIQPGLQYDVWDSTMATCYTTRGWCMVSANVDFYAPATLTLYFQNTTDAAEFAAAVGSGGTPDDVFLVPYSAIPDRSSSGASASIAPCGYQWWLRATGTLYGSFGDLNVANYGSMFKSRVAAVSAALTEAVLNKYITNFEDATGVDLDSIILTHGVYTNLLATYGTDGSSLIRVNRDLSNASRVQLGQAGIGFVAPIGGRDMTIHVSSFLNKGEVVVLKTGGGNLIRYRPPKVDGTDNATPSFDPGIEWLGKLFGDSIWLPSIGAAGGRTDGMEAPFDLLMQHAAEEMRGIRLTACTETTP